MDGSNEKKRSSRGREKRREGRKGRREGGTNLPILVEHDFSMDPRDIRVVETDL